MKNNKKSTIFGIDANLFGHVAYLVLAVPFTLLTLHGISSGTPRFLISALFASGFLFLSYFYGEKYNEGLEK